MGGGEEKETLGPTFNLFKTSSRTAMVGLNEFARAEAKLKPVPRSSCVDIKQAGTDGYST